MKKTIKKIDDDDKIVILEKYKGLDTLNKILICMYILIFLSILNISLPYIIKLVDKLTDKNTTAEKGVYDVSMFNVITGSDIANYGNTKDVRVLFICHQDYKECQDFLPVVQEAQKEYGYTTDYLSADELNYDEVRNNLLKYDNDDKFIEKVMGGIPIVLTIKNNKLVQGWVGVSNINDFKVFLNNSGIK